MKWFMVYITNNHQVYTRPNIQPINLNELSLSNVYAAEGKHAFGYYSIASTSPGFSAYIDEDMAIIGDIDIHNIMELMAKLSDLRSEIHAHEVIIGALYRKYGIQGVKYISGEFSFVLIDERFAIIQGLDL